MQQKGQALITLLFFVVIAVSVTTAAIVVLVANSQASTSVEQGLNAYYLAESGLENALLRLARNPSYTGETLQIGTGSVTIQVTSGNTVTIKSTATIGNWVRKIQVDGVYNNTVFTISSWKEI